MKGIFLKGILAVGLVAQMVNISAECLECSDGSKLCVTVSSDSKSNKHAKEISVTKGSSVRLKAQVTGGSGNYTYSWTDLDSGDQFSKDTSAVYTGKDVGSHECMVLVTDANNEPCYVEKLFTVKVTEKAAK